MNTRFLVAMAVSGAVHMGAFVMGSGLYDRSMTGPEEYRVTDTLTVSVSVAAFDSTDRDYSPPVPEARHPAGKIAASQQAEPEVAPRNRVVSSRARSVRAEAGHTAEAASEELARAEPSPPGADVPQAGAGSAHGQRQRGRPVQSASNRAAPAPAEAAAGQRTDPFERTYLSEFLTELSRHKHYPQSARLRQQQGRVVVAILLQRDGTIADVALAEKSGHHALDRAALRSVKRMGRFRPFPDSMDRDEWRLSVPFKYAIDGG